MVGIIDYEAGNAKSVANALQCLHCPHFTASRPEELYKADKLIFPGVGSASAAVFSLQQSGLFQAIQKTKVPLLGICLGMQLLFEFSEEGNTQGLGFLSGKVIRFSNSIQNYSATDHRKLKIPHMGWNQIHYRVQEHPLFSGIPDASYFYFVHSYYIPMDHKTPILATTTYGSPFACVVLKNNYYGVQFHPEKSGTLGRRFLQNFLSI